MRIYIYPIVFAAFFPGALAARAQDAHDSSTPCVEVQIGQDIASHINCVNEALRRVVQHEHDAPAVEAPITAQSASNTVGTFNDAAAHQMMGNAFGASSQPQRPKSTFTSPLVRATH